MLTRSIHYHATVHSARRQFLLAADLTRNPRLALRWLRTRAHHIATQLDPPHAQPLRHWLTDEAEHEHVLHRLVRGHPCTLTAYDDEARYVLHTEPTR
ncbi:hypothetical protein JJV70_18870 [Streptomyces sp. JJ66]|uniref:hypothetical protein n=1 Tax=Streptomyces sp. JJ66 TaxID=2803843 RepID=UPI001C599332|nr:hypothetical protein [Streptomyces sp. JJ66]MBW1604132.1 hypothetical protein [Streptomyces sp. JJ66]